MTYETFKNQYAAALSAEQDAAVQAVDGSILLLAVPGSGKTTVLVTRLGYMLLVRGIAPESILTMTYTVAAAGDMRRRFAALFGQELADRLEFRTINGVSARIIAYYERSLNRRAFDLVTNERELGAILGEVYRKQTGEFATDATVKSLRTAITYAKNMQLSEQDMARIRVDEASLAPIYKEYCAALREKRLMDYDDQMVYALQILRQYPQITQYFRKKYRYICVDEAQDTSLIQHKIINILSQESGNLFMVGDEDQSIYGFRAAYPDALLSFEADHPGARVLLLEKNYRSTPQIVAVADGFIAKNKSRREKHMTADREDGAAVRVIDVRDRLGQYAYLEKVAKDCRTETAVLFRNNDSALPLIDRLSRSGDEYFCRGFDGTFFTSRTVRDISDIIHLAYVPGDGEAFMRIYYKLGAGISRNAAEAVSKMRTEDILGELVLSDSLSQWSRTKCKALQTHLSNLRFERADRAIYRIVNFMGYGEYLETHDADSAKIPILSAIGASEPTPLRLLERLDELEKIVRQGAQKCESGLLLSTIHSSKGLEYERVFLLDVAEGILPALAPDETDPAVMREYEEERRIFYVAMTRARDELAIFRFQTSDLFSSFTEEIFPRKTESEKKYGVNAPSSVASEVGTLRLEVGDIVRHRTFGEGFVCEVQSETVKIRFRDGSIRQFYTAFLARAKQIDVIT
jgi:DNA helicase-2/ATP-dependent DNA helicase PcrA